MKKIIKKRFALLMGIVMICSLAACAPAAQPSAPTQESALPSGSTVQSAPESSSAKDGVYSGTARGNNGEVAVDVTVKDGAIAGVNVTGHSETPSIADRALAIIPGRIVDLQSVRVDAISGATNTSYGIMLAARSALQDAGADIAVFDVKKEVETEPVSDTTADAVVVGAGGAGMMTAIRLKEAGKNVILLEKRDIAGGSTTLAASYFTAVNTEMQKAAGKGMTIEEYLEQTKKSTPNMNLDNLRVMLEKAQDNIDWLVERGVDLSQAMSAYQVGIGDGSSLGIPMAGAMIKEVEKQGIDMRLGNKAVEILTENGNVVGVKVETDGSAYTIKTGHVVLTTGGYASNPEMVNKYAPEWAGVYGTSASGSTGDGFVLAEKAGGALGFMEEVRMNPSVYSNGATSVSVSVCRLSGGIMVNVEGNRFCDDYYREYTQLSKWIREQPGDHVFVVFDQTSMDNFVRVREFYEQGYYLEGATVEELAQKMEVPADNLAATIEKYHKVFDTGVDEEFGRTVSINTRLDKAPYYAVKCAPGIQVTLGGINVDNKMQALREDGSVIEGLYAAGECANDGLFGGGPTHINMTFGPIAAETILEKLA